MRKMYLRDPATKQYRWYDPEKEPLPSESLRKCDSKHLRSQAAGVNPDQIPEIKKRFPHHNFDPVTGDMLFKDRNEKLRHLKDIGFHDKEEVRG